ncbi:MAG: neuromedin U [Planctomycetota bacterium]|jgi:hypothetical protein
MKGWAVACTLLAVLAVLVAVPATALAGEGAAGEDDAAALAKQTQNPVADLISLPIQNNINFGVGPKDKIQTVTNIQPVIPFSLGEWKVITRTVVPVIGQPAFTDSQDRDYGLGDTSLTAWFCPPSGALTWGFGPVGLFPTSTDSRLGAGRWGLGPSVVLVAMEGPWVYGGLVSNVWGIGGTSKPDVNLFSTQIFVNYNLSEGWYLTSSPLITADWEADSSQRWTVPVGGGVGRVWAIGKQKVNTQVQAFWNPWHPDNGPDWSLRLQMQFLFPK